MASFPKTLYLSPLVPNAEIVDKTTNQYFKSSHAPYVVDDEAEFVLDKIILNTPQYPCVHSNL